MTAPGAAPAGDGVSRDDARPRIAFVIQRYGEEVTGGSESLARAVAERLLPWYRVSVFTSCAVDYVTWANVLPAGPTMVNGVEVRRFPAVGERDLEAFNTFSDTLYDKPHTRDDEVEWLRRQGPEVPALVEALRAEADAFHAVVFFTYLYYPTVWGLVAAPARSVLIPTTHDEPPLRFSIFAEAFAAAAAYGFLTPPEEELVRTRFGVGARPSTVAGIGVDMSEASPAAVAEFRTRHRLVAPYAIYAGRIDAGKGCAEMIAHHERYRAAGGTANLVLIGTLAMDLPASDWLRPLGFLSEHEKVAALSGASVVVCPSAYESLSIVLLEGFAAGVPGLVNARSAVLRDHCLRSNGGLFYEDGDEYAVALDRLIRDESLRKALGESGRSYVSEHYQWEAVIDRYRWLLEQVASAGR